MTMEVKSLTNRMLKTKIYMFDWKICSVCIMEGVKVITTRLGCWPSIIKLYSL